MSAAKDLPPPPQAPKAEPIADYVWRQECLNLSLALHIITSDQVGAIALDLGAFVLDADGDQARSVRFQVARSLVQRFPNMAPENFVTRVKAVATAVVEDAK